MSALWIIAYAVCFGWGFFVSAAWDVHVFQSVKDFWIVISMPLVVSLLATVIEGR